jgi:hypothetical protein
LFTIGQEDPTTTVTTTTTNPTGIATVTPGTNQATTASTVQSVPCISVRGSTLDALLTTTYCRNQKYLSRQLAQLHPELTMPMFSGKL